jgi:hypothetical protein
MNVADRNPILPLFCSQRPGDGGRGFFQKVRRHRRVDEYLFCVFDRSPADFLRGSEHGGINCSSESVYGVEWECALRPNLSRRRECPSPQCPSLVQLAQPASPVKRRNTIASKNNNTTPCF